MLGQHRSTQRKQPTGRADEERLVADMIELARQYGRYGYRRIAALPRDAGWQINDKRVERLWRREGLKVPAKQPKKGRLWLNDGSCVRLTGIPLSSASPTRHRKSTPVPLAQRGRGRLVSCWWVEAVRESFRTCHRRMFMSISITDRRDDALIIQRFDKLSAVLTLLSSAVENAELDGVAPEADPAVCLIADRLGELAGVDNEKREQFEKSCRAHVAKRSEKPKLIQLLDQRIAGDADRKDAFLLESLRLLRELANVLPGTAYLIKPNRGRPNLSGEVTLHGPDVYIRVTESFAVGKEVLYRRPRSLIDNTGDKNFYAAAEMLYDPEAFAQRVVHDLDLGFDGQ